MLPVTVRGAPQLPAGWESQVGYLGGLRGHRAPDGRGRQRDHSWVGEKPVLPGASRGSAVAEALIGPSKACVALLTFRL